MEKLGNFIQSSKRVFVIATKPSGTEYSTMAKVTGIGIIIIAVIGFIMTLFFSLTGIGF